jgi:hypothetical protein
MSLALVLGALLLFACLTVLVVRVQDQPVLATQLQDQTAADEVIANVGPIGTSVRLTSIRGLLRKRWWLFARSCAHLRSLGMFDARPSGFDYFAVRSVSLAGF